MRLPWRPTAPAKREAPAPFVAIGHVSAAPSTAPRDWSRAESRIEMRPELVPALAGLADYSHIIVVFALDRVEADGRSLLTQRPPGAPGDIGVLALRTQSRPNPIGVSVVSLVRIDGATLHVRGLDAFEGTPVLDIKPYIPYYDSVPDAKVPAWIAQP